MKVYEMIFEVTTTCQNGNERRMKKSVYSPCFRNGRHIVELERVSKAIKVLEANHYYNIKHLQTRYTTMLMTEEGEQA